MMIEEPRYLTLKFSTSISRGTATLIGTELNFRGVCDASRTVVDHLVSNSLASFSGQQGMKNVCLIFVEARHCYTLGGELVELRGGPESLAATAYQTLQKIISPDSVGQKPVGWATNFGYFKVGAHLEPFLRRAIHCSKRLDTRILSLPRNNNSNYTCLAPHQIYVEVDNTPVHNDAKALAKLTALLAPTEGVMWERCVENRAHYEANKAESLDTGLDTPSGIDDVARSEGMTPVYAAQGLGPLDIPPTSRAFANPIYKQQGKRIGKVKFKVEIEAESITGQLIDELNSLLAKHGCAFRPLDMYVNSLYVDIAVPDQNIVSLRASLNELKLQAKTLGVSDVAIHSPAAGALVSSLTTAGLSKRMVFREEQLMPILVTLPKLLCDEIRKASERVEQFIAEAIFSDLPPLHSKLGSRLRTTVEEFEIAVPIYLLLSLRPARRYARFIQTAAELSPPPASLFEATALALMKICQPIGFLLSPELLQLFKSVQSLVEEAVARRLIREFRPTSSLDDFEFATGHQLRKQ